ncbi:YkvA family protein [Pseudonocardia sp. N23]|uniref:YkvA family protein n=1 Tax=Pseudonocardia sp. N23 TaxID=1987376 RepID=UPI001C0F0E4B|nr:YkvA family protein [Pseudonocardia sp. N23]
MAGTSGSKARTAGAAGMAGRFGPRRLAAFRALWTLVRQTRRPGAPGVGDMFRAFPRMAGAAVTGRYPGLTTSRLFLFVLAAVYLVSPVDVVPEIVFNVFGLVDDAVVALWLGGAVLAETDRFLHWERTDGARPGTYDGIVEGEVVGETVR